MWAEAVACAAKAAACEASRASNEGSNKPAGGSTTATTKTATTENGHVMNFSLNKLSKRASEQHNSANERYAARLRHRTMPNEI